MNQEKLIENKKADKTAWRKLLFMFIASFVGGCIIGFCSAWVKEQTEGIGEIFIRGLKWFAPYGNLAAGTIFFLIIGILFVQGKKIYQGWDGEDEEVLNKCEMKLTYALILTNLCVIVSYFFMGTGFYALVVRLEDISTLIPLIILITGIFYILIGSSIFQKKIINLEKEINPEKQGSIYDMKFAKIWLESCDEAERLQIYKCAYKSFRVTQGAFIVVWLLCFVGMITWDFGIMPMTAVLIIWAVATISYSAEAVRMSKNPSMIMK